MSELVDVRVDDTRVVAFLEEGPARIRAAMIRAVMGEGIRLETRVKEKLAGEVLNERSHRLHDSIHSQFGQDVNSVSTKVGTNVVYAKVHEFGGTWQIREHMRNQTMAWGRPMTPREVLVRAHTATFPERSFLRSTLTEMGPASIERIRLAAQRAAASETGGAP